MGEVYLAQHPRLPRRDALKVLPEAMSVDDEFRDRFNREADLAAGLFHPHIVGVHDRGEFDGRLWISMDYVEGNDAAALVREEYPRGMPTDEALNIVSALAGALDYAHQRGLLHRDVKPANILLSQPDDDGERRILLADFGIARQLGSISGLTATNLTVGTVAYAAPEQLMGQDLDGRADQYALAATTFHLLSGVPPYQHSNPVAVISQHLTASLPKLRDHRPDLAILDDVLSTAMSKDPSDRFTRCRQFARALEDRLANPSRADGLPTEAAATVLSNTATATARSASSAASRQHANPVLARRLAITTIVAALAAGIIVVGFHIGSRIPTRGRQVTPATSETVKVPPSTASATAMSPPAAPASPPATSAPTTTTTTAAAGPALGESCSSWSKLAYDAGAGTEIICDGATGAGATPHWTAFDPSQVTGTHTRGTSCGGFAPYTMSRSTDNYMITCEPDSSSILQPVAGPGSMWTIYHP